MTADALPYIPSNMDNDECFRLYGTLPSERILQLLDAEADTIASAGRIAEAVQEAHDGLPCEDFAEDIVWRLETLRDDESAIDAAAAATLQAIITDLTKLQADLYERAEAAVKRLQGIEDELSAWVRS
jgi:hypothetical protein